MKQRKATEKELQAASKISSILMCLSLGFFPEDEDSDRVLSPEESAFDPENPENCKRAIKLLFDSDAGGGALDCVVACAHVLLDPANKVVNPDVSYLDHHPSRVTSEPA